MRFMTLLPGVLLLVVGFPITASAETQTELSEQEQQYVEWARKTWESLDPQQGEVKLPNDVATLDVPDSFYYLDPEDTETVLVEVWGNPPGQKTLGMLFPAQYTPFDNASWGVTIDYVEEGYVSDENADEIDYDELLAQMKQGTSEASEERVKQGYEPIELVGWASAPFYDKDTHKLHWAKEIKFGDQADNTLNYNIRVLGRKGYLLLNFVANMKQKPEIDQQLDTVLSMAQFKPGYRYSEFDPDVDEVAAYGIGALVAGKVAAKTGLLAAALVFLKKFGVLILIGIGAVTAKVFKRKRA